MRAEGDGREDVKLNITPMIDVTFLLLIFFMCAMKFKTLDQKIAAFLPKHKGLAPNVVPFEDPLKIQVVLKRAPGETSTRVKLLDTQIGVDQDGFRLLDAGIARIHGDPSTAELPGMIDAWPDVPHEDVVRCLDAFLKAGLTNVEFRGTKMP